MRQKPSAAQVRQAQEHRILRHFKAGASVPTLAWWYHRTQAEIEAILRRGTFPLLEADAGEEEEER